MSDDHPLRTLEAPALVATGGFAGANLRYLLGLALPDLLGTLAANALGSFALGFVLYGSLRVGPLSDRARLLVATGFLSSFTTYSTFAVRTATLDSPLLMLGNVGATYALGFAGVLAGRALVGLVEGTSA